MNCDEFSEWMAEYLSNEMQGARRKAFQAHRDTCAACAGKLGRSLLLDERIRRAVTADTPETAAILSRFRSEVRQEEVRQEAARRQWLRVAAGIALVAAGWAGYRQLAPHPVSGFLAAAARDHRVEVTEGSQRRWRSATEDVAPLLARYGVPTAAVEGLVPAGFRFERAKQCGIDGERALHLVFSDGVRAVSVYVRAKSATHPAADETVGAEHVAEFPRGAVVTTGSAELCAETARRLSAL